MNITVNDRTLLFTGSQISYEEVVELAGMKGTPSVTYHGRKKGDRQRSGIMWPGCKQVELDEGFVFNVAHTGSA